MTKKYKSVDSVLIDQPTDSTIKSDVVSALRKDKNPKLVVTIDATHSGVLTNRRVYPGKFVSTGYKTFFSKANGGDAEYDKPVLKHHELEKDAIGRVVRAVFTPLKSGLEFSEDYKRPEPMGSRGSGVVTVTASITDPESIEKIIDGRYLSVSAGHTTDSMTCSICNKSITRCGHWPGKYYDNEGEECDETDGFLCFYITGNMSYDELSFVNYPAQPSAKMMGFNWEDFSKSDLNKDTLLIESMVRGKKSLVRDFSFVDESGEYNLLQAKKTDAVKKEIVAMSSPASNTSNSPGVTIDLLPGEKKKETTAKDKPIADSKPTKENKMDPENKKEGLDAATLEASLKTVTEKITALEATKTADAQKIASLEASLSSKNSEIERLTAAQTDMQVELSKALATALTSFRIKMGKSDASGLDTAEKFNEYVVKLAKRTPESLRDSINDIVPELNQTQPESPKGDTGANNLVVNKDKLKAPTQVDTKNKTVRAGNEATPAKTSDNKTTLDNLLS